MPYKNTIFEAQNKESGLFFSLFAAFLDRLWFIVEARG